MTGKDSALLLFEPLLAQLRRQGFRIGVEHHLRVRSLLNRLGSDCAPSDLKTLLCPIFASSAEQQEYFYRAFDSLYPLLTVDEKWAPSVNPANDVAKVVTVRRWPYVVAGLAVLIFGVALLTRKTQPSINPSPQVEQPNQATQTKAPDSAPKQGPIKPPPPPQPDSSVKVLLNRLPPSVSLGLARYERWRVALGWTSVLTPLLTWLFAELYRIRRRQLLIRNARGKTPPYSWPVRADFAAEIYDPRELVAATRVLHRRYLGEARELDVASTVSASIAALGFPTFRYRRASRLPEYLFLIDRLGFRDHQAHLYEHLAAVLRSQGWYVSEYFYEGDPRICWNRTGEECLPLGPTIPRSWRSSPVAVWRWRPIAGSDYRRFS